MSSAATTALEVRARAAADLSPIDHRSVVEQLRADRHLSDAQLVDIGRAMILPARPGSKVFAQTLWSITGPAVDVHPDHLLLDGTTRDKRRDRSSHRIDWQVERVTELDLLTPSELLDELVELYHMRVAALSGRRSA